MVISRESQQRTQSGENGTYDVPDVAAMLKCSDRHIRRLVEAGVLPGVIRLGRLVRFHRRLINEWIAASCPGSQEGDTHAD
jgi:excisionase family DNA binding protein